MFNLNREKKLKIAWGINYSLITVSVILYFFSTNPVTEFTLLFVPMAIFIAVFIMKGFIRYENYKGAKYPEVTQLIFTLVGFVLLKNLARFQVIDISNLWKYIFAISAVLTLLLYISGKRKEFKFFERKDIFILGLFYFIFCLHSYNIMIYLNYYLDKNPPKQYVAQISNKYKSGGKSTSYYLEFSSTTTPYNVDSISVGSYDYSNINISNRFYLYIYDGYFNVPWMAYSFDDSLNRHEIESQQLENALRQVRLKMGD